MNLELFGIGRFAVWIDLHWNPEMAGVLLDVSDYGFFFDLPTLCGLLVNQWARLLFLIDPFIC
jgi:hypothetical protein